MMGVDVFDKTTEQTQLWVSEVADELGWDDQHKTFQILRATLRVLRDRLTLGEAAHLGSQLPILLPQGEVEDGMGILPVELKELFPETVRV